MAVTATLYDHTVKKIVDGEFPDGERRGPLGR